MQPIKINPIKTVVAAVKSITHPAITGTSPRTAPKEYRPPGFSGDVGYSPFSAFKLGKINWRNH